jgi:hypothetical protein
LGISSHQVREVEFGQEGIRVPDFRRTQFGVREVGVRQIAVVEFDVTQVCSDKFCVAQVIERHINVHQVAVREVGLLAGLSILQPLAVSLNPTFDFSFADSFKLHKNLHFE